MYAIHPMTIEAAREIAAWQYAPPYDIYSMPGDREATVEFLLDPENRYHVVFDGEKQLAGYCCFGADARVPGGDYSDERALDIGVGMHPSLTGQRRGRVFVTAVIDFAVARYAPTYLRATIAHFNRRSQRTFESCGFTPIQTFVSVTSSPRKFVILTRGMMTSQAIALSTNSAP